ncbi:hypothetical protein Pst134EB_025382 [Puccinia striiformis f. sp. tritici]|nr:hypothetical protein Pst134EB_025382 [Puccinia striiformis f. sp. tritici]
MADTGLSIYSGTKVEQKIKSNQAKIESLITEFTADGHQEALNEQLPQTHLAKPTTTV